MQNSARREGGLGKVTGRTIRVLGSVTRERGLGRSQGTAIRVLGSVIKEGGLGTPQGTALRVLVCHKGRRFRGVTRYGN